MSEKKSRTVAFKEKLAEIREDEKNTSVMARIVDFFLLLTLAFPAVTVARNIIPCFVISLYGMPLTFVVMTIIVLKLKKLYLHRATRVVLALVGFFGLFHLLSSTLAQHEELFRFKPVYIAVCLAGGWSLLTVSLYCLKLIVNGDRTISQKVRFAVTTIHGLCMTLLTSSIITLYGAQLIGSIFK